MKPNPRAEKWVKKNLLKLLSLGWTKKELFEHGKFLFPHGDWGVVYHPWPCEPELDEKGNIVFKIPQAAGKVVIQKIYKKRGTIC